MDESPDDLVDTMRADIRYAENTGAQKIHSAQPVFFCSLSFVLCTSWYVFAPQVFFRSGKHYFTGKTPEFGIDWEEADWAFHHINEPKARVIIKKYRITHFYIPG